MEKFEAFEIFFLVGVEGRTFVAVWFVKLKVERKVDYASEPLQDESQLHRHNDGCFMGSVVSAN